MKMTHKTDAINRDELCALITKYWHPTPRTRRILEKAIWEPPKPPDFILDSNLELGHDERIWHEMELNQETDLTYRTYCDYVNHYVPSATLRIALKRYEVWTSGRYNNRRLFKYLAQHMPEDTIKMLTTTRNTSKNYLVLSKNPIDLFMCSSGQSFSSCMGLSSTYSGAYYMSLPALLYDPTRFMMFRTPGKIARTQLKDHEIAHFRYIQRAFAFWTQDQEFAPIRSYPSEKMTFQEMFTHTNIPTTSRSGWRTDEYHIPRLKAKCGYTMFPYQDTTSRYYRNKISYGLVDSYGPGSPEGLELGTDFEKMPAEFMIYGFRGKICQCCGKYKRRVERRVITKTNGEKYMRRLCDGCVANKYTYCRDCGSIYVKGTINFLEVHRFDRHGEKRASIKYCNNCATGQNRVTVTCGHCGILTHEGSAPFLSYEHVCFGCVPANRRGHCLFCEEPHYRADMDKMSGHGYVCSSCWDKAYWCTNCLKPFSEGFAIHGSNKTVCNNCVVTIYTDRYAGKDPQYDAWQPSNPTENRS